MACNQNRVSGAWLPLAVAAALCLPAVGQGTPAVGGAVQQTSTKEGQPGVTETGGAPSGSTAQEPRSQATAMQNTVMQNTATQTAATQNTAELPNAPGLCTLEGTVRDTDGGVVPDARVTLTGEGKTTERAVLTDADGEYVLPDVPCHHFELSVARPGFQPTVLAGSLSSTGETEQQDVVLKMAAANASVTVTATQREIAAAQVHIQEQQRLVGVFPNFYVSYQWNAAKLTTRQKFGLAWHVVRDPVTLGQVALTAGIQQATNSLPGYGSGAAGYGRRFGSGVGNTVAGVYLGGAVLPTLFRQDPRYFYRGTGSKPSRLWYAVSRVFVTRGDDGSRQPNYSGLLGDFGSGAVGNLWAAREDRQGARLTLINGAVGVASDAFNNVLEELVLRHFTTRKGGPGKAGATP